jgi:putative ABC transport system permease protein
MLHDVMADLRFGLRMLRRAPAFTVAAVLTLALGVGANTAVFSIVDGLWLRPLPIDDARHLVVVYTSQKTSRGVNAEGPTSYPDLVDYRAGAPAFSGIAGFDVRGGMLRVGDEVKMLLTFVVTENYFSVLGVKALHGRVFTEREFAGADAPREVVISHKLWQKYFAGDPGIVGHTIRLTGSDFLVAGVMPREFRGTRLMIAPDIYMPATVWGRGELVDRGYAHFELFGRLKPGVRLDEAQEQVDAVGRHLEAAYPKERSGRVITLQYEPDTRRAVAAFLFLGIAMLVLLIACANVATLLMARAETRRTEMATRLALGGTRLRLSCQLLTESLPLAAAGLGAAILVASWVVTVVPTLLPPQIAAYGFEFHVDHRAALFAAGAALASLVMFGVAPALMSFRVALVGELKEGGAAGTSKARAWGRHALVVAQVVLSVMLLTGATLLARTFVNVVQQDLGFDSRGQALIVQILPGDRSFAKRYPQLLDRLNTIPGVERASLGNRAPMADYNGGRTKIVYVPGMQLPPDQQGVPINEGTADGGYFQALGMTLLRGRTFSARDTAASPKVAIFNQAAAGRLFGTADAVGRHFHLGGPDGPDCEVVGVVRDAKYNDVVEETMPYLYLPQTQDSSGDVALVLRTRVEAAAVAPAVRAQLRAFDPGMTVVAVETMADHMRAALSVQRLSAQLVGVLGLLGLALAVVGLYGVLAYYVTRRRHEIGVRMAIGAPARAVFGMVVRRGLVLAAIGIVIGAAGALASMHLLAGLLFGVSPRDPVSLALVACLLLVVTVLAAAAPAYRAAAVNPIAALRYE